jgi:hypothetical protein
MPRMPGHLDEQVGTGILLRLALFGAVLVHCGARVSDSKVEQRAGTDVSEAVSSIRLMYIVDDGTTTNTKGNVKPAVAFLVTEVSIGRSSQTYSTWNNCCCCVSCTGWNHPWR